MVQVYTLRWRISWGRKSVLIPVNKLLFLAYSTSFIKGGSAPGSNPSPFYNIMFDRKGTPFVYLPLENSTSLTYLINRINRYKGKFSFHFPVTFNKPKSHDGLLGASYPEPWKRHSFRIEPPHIGYYREYPLFFNDTHSIFYYPPLGGIHDTVNMILSSLFSVAGSYTRLSKVTFVTGAGLTRAVIQLRGQSLTKIQLILNQ